MSYIDGKKQPIIALSIIYFISLSLRLVPTLMLGGMPFWDSYAHYWLIESYLETHDGSVFQRSHLGFYSMNIVITTFTGIPTFAYARFFPPFFDSLTVIPIYLLTEKLIRNQRAALYASLFFGITEIIVLRQSYLIPEGFAIYFMVLIFYLIFKLVYSEKFWRFFSLSCFSFYCLCSFHNLTSTMTFLPLVATLFIILLLSFRFLRLFSGPIIEPVQFKRFFCIAIAFACVWIFWAKERQFIGFLSLFISLDITGMITFLSREREPASEVFTERHHATQETTLFDLAAMASGSILIFLISFLSVLKSVKDPKKDFRLYFLIIWFLTMTSNFILNFLLDSMFGAASGQQAYRAWIFMIIPSIILTSKKISEIKDKRIFHTILLSSLVILFIGSVWFVEYLMESFPHIRS